MSTKRAVPHLMVVVPGIGGSVLRRGDRDLWKLSLPVAWRALTTAGRSLEELVPDDPSALDDPDFDDGVRATGLLESPISLPGLARLTGYDWLRDAVHERYELDERNYLEFAYDWRRDLRINAEHLRQAVDDRLAALDPYVGRAEVIMLAHSMGGLVARWWLDQLGGGERCRGLIALGTPYRGSPKAVRMLTGGFVWRSIGSQRFAGLLRELPAVHQLLPMYRTVLVDDEWRYVHEAPEGTLPGVDRTRAAAGREVLLTLNETERPSLTTVIAGTGQATVQSSSISGNNVAFDGDRLPPDWGPAGSHDGDATVPWIAARPLDQGRGGLTPTFIAQSHGGLSRDREMLAALMSRLDHLLVDDDKARSAYADQPLPVAGDVAERRLGLSLDEDYLSTEPVVVHVSSEGLAPGTAIALRVEGRSGVVTSLDERGQAEVDLGPLEPGSHRLELRPADPGGYGGLVVTDTLDVWE